MKRLVAEDFEKPYIMSFDDIEISVYDVTGNFFAVEHIKDNSHIDLDSLDVETIRKAIVSHAKNLFGNIVVDVDNTDSDYLDADGTGVAYLDFIVPMKNYCIEGGFTFRYTCK